MITKDKTEIVYNSGEKDLKQVQYEYKNCPIPGGGYVTGFLFHPETPDVLYCRTDIGGTYRYRREDNCWTNLNEDVGMLDLSLTYPIALCTDKNNKDSLYIVSGCYHWETPETSGLGTFSISKDGGKSFCHKPLPCLVHGNLPGRGSGVRLIKITCAEEEIFYYASQREGLFCSTDNGDHWTNVDVCGEKHLTFVWANEDGKTLIVGTAGVENGKTIITKNKNEARNNSEMRGHSLFVSYDAGKSFEPMPMPENIVLANSKRSGYVPHRYDFDGTYFYCTMNYTGPHGFIMDLSYSCDSGKVINGRVLRYAFDENGKICGYEDITPGLEADDKHIYEADKTKPYNFGFGGISSCMTEPGLLTTSTICRDWGDIVYISYDYGNTWEVALQGLYHGNIHFNTSYMKPEYNGGYSLIHWLTDIKINPFNKDEVWFNTGTGVFRGVDFTKDNRSFSDCCKGIEETVHLQVHSPLEGPVQALDVIGDLGGFAFTDLDKPCENSFADENGNRYITCQNLDYSDGNPQYVIATARGNWKGFTKGGLIWSEDYGLTFDRLPLPYGVSEYINERCKIIEKPNTNAGWVALGAENKSIVFCVSNGNRLPIKGIVMTKNLGKTYEKVSVFDENGQDISDSDIGMKVLSDRVKPNVFYGIGDGFCLYKSEDYGNTFYRWKQTDVEVVCSMEQENKGDSCENQAHAGSIGKNAAIKAAIKEMLDYLSDIQFGMIESNTKTEIRPENYKSGVFYAAFNEAGLWKIDFGDERPKLVRLSNTGDSFYCLGLGRKSMEKEYQADDKVLYVCGIIDEQYGFYRTYDYGRTWEKLNNEKQQFGEIRSIDGDSRKPGRFFIATGSFGLKYGEEL